MAEMSQASTFVWYELHTADATGAAAFYTKILPWTVDQESFGNEYSIINVSAGQIGGVLQKPAETLFNRGKAGWIAYISVASLNASTAQLKALGGALYMEPQDIPHVGKFAVVADPQGAPFVLFEPLPGSNNNLPAEGTPGAIGWHELTALDGTSDYQFYQEMFGWQKGGSVPIGENEVYQMFTIAGTECGAIMTRMEPDQDPYWRYYFNVMDTAASAALVKENGGTITWGPSAVPGGQIVACCVDPQGAEFGLVGPKV